MKEKLVYIGSNIPDKTPAGVRVFANALALREYGFDVKIISKDIESIVDFDLNKGIDTWHLRRAKSTKEWISALINVKGVAEMGKPWEYGDYIAYCGNMAGNKDGVLNLIDAFNMASPIIPDVKLLLIGGSSNQDDWEEIVKVVKDTGNGNIILYGKASRDEMPALLNVKLQLQAA